jgi:hypothetical protein
LFDNLKRALQTDEKGEPHPFAFNPTVYALNQNSISIRFNFVDPSKLEISEQARFRIRIKEPAMLRTQQSLYPLTRDQIFDREHFYEGPIPP